MSGREVRLAVVVGLFLFSGFLPCVSLPLRSTGGARWSSGFSSASSPWWGWNEMSGSTGCSFNKPVGGLLDLEMGSFLLTFSSCSHGGGRGGMEELWSRLCRPDKAIRAWSISSAAIVGKALALTRDSSLPGKSCSWRLMVGLRCFVVADFSGRTATILFLPVENHKGGSREPARRPLPRLPFRWRGGGELTAPSGVVPGDDELGPVMEPIHRIGLRSTSVIWGPLCKVYVSGCIFYLSRVLL